MLSSFNNIDASPANIGVLLCAALLVAYVILQSRRKSIKNLQGPSSDSWLVGNLSELTRTMNVGEAEFSWTRNYGNTLRIKGVFGSDILFTADPKALQYVLNASGYNFPKSPESRVIIDRIAGKGLSYVEGAHHIRQKKMMNPAFSYNALRSFLPSFQHTAQRTIVKWKDLMASNAKSSVVMDIPMWLSRTTLDAIGTAAFDYDFGALNEENDNELAATYNNLFADAFMGQSDAMIAMDALPGILPRWVCDAMLLIPNQGVKRLQAYMRVARSVAKSLVDRQLELHANGEEGGKDIMSILVRANLAENPKDKLSEDEILAQMTTLMIAGHESTASTLAWLLHELAPRPELQNELREEIKAARAQAERRGDDLLSMADLDSMKLLNSMIKETLRFHPIVSRLERVASRDDVIPLESPIVTKSGKVIRAIPIRKGQRVFLGTGAYHRLKSVWGEDADVWRPKRFMEGIEKLQPFNIGTFANILTFSSGVRACIGWRFTVIELQALLVEFVENFEFSPPPGNVEILRAAASIMTPMIKGAKERKTELPLTVRPVETR